MLNGWCCIVRDEEDLKTYILYSMVFVKKKECKKCILDARNNDLEHGQLNRYIYSDPLKVSVESKF